MNFHKANNVTLAVRAKLKRRQAHFLSGLAKRDFHFLLVTQIFRTRQMTNLASLKSNRAQSHNQPLVYITDMFTSTLAIHIIHPKVWK